MRWKLFIPILSLFFFLMLIETCFAGDTEKEARKLYNKAQKSCLAQKWDKAINLFQELLEQFPNSRYQDDARFWIGYILKKKGYDFRACDGISGEIQGIKMRKVFLRAFREMHST